MGVFTKQDWQIVIKVCPYTFESSAKAAEGLTMVRILLSPISILPAEVRGIFFYKLVSRHFSVCREMRLFPVGANPTRQMSLRPVPPGAVQGGNELD